MKQLYIFFLIFSILLVAVMLWPGFLINPGPLSQQHEALRGQCLSCHTPFFGTPSSKCGSCHTTGEIGLKGASGQELAAGPDSTIALLHMELTAMACIACHTDHNLPGKGAFVAHMDHGALTAERQENCKACHAPDMPKDVFHRQTGEGCGQCHDTNRWEHVTFDHEKWMLTDLGRSGNCIGCHEPDRPDDLLHMDAGDACMDCHMTTAWKPVNFDHDQWFRFDRSHPARCSACHDNPKDYRQYTCYGCHEHSKRDIAREHREEGIREFSNCAECHRNSNEDDAEHLWRKKSGASSYSD